MEGLSDKAASSREKFIHGGASGCAATTYRIKRSFVDYASTSARGYLRTAAHDETVTEAFGALHG